MLSRWELWWLDLTAISTTTKFSKILILCVFPLFTCTIKKWHFRTDILTALWMSSVLYKFYPEFGDLIASFQWKVWNSLYPRKPGLSFHCYKPRCCHSPYRCSRMGRLASCIFFCTVFFFIFFL